MCRLAAFPSSFPREDAIEILKRFENNNTDGTGAGWIDENGVMIQDRDPKKIYFVDVPYMHFSLLPRGGNRKADEIVVKRPQKLKHELGVEFPKDFFYPEVFFRQRPKIIPSPWGKMSLPFRMRAAFETPLRKVKRKVWRSKVGY